MVQLTMQVSNELANRLQPITRWLPTIIELSLAGYTTPAAAVAAEVTQFLAANPTPQSVLAYHISDLAQERLRRLLILNESGMLSEEEQKELDELQHLEHIIILLKAEIGLRQEA